jgi:hypothetical protein
VNTSPATWITRDCRVRWIESERIHRVWKGDDTVMAMSVAATQGTSKSFGGEDDEQILQCHGEMARDTED